MKTAETLLELIGQTPVLRLSPFETPGMRLCTKLTGMSVVAVAGLAAARSQPRSGADDQ